MHVTVPAACVHPGRRSGHEVTCGGSVSVTVMPGDVEGPRFVTRACRRARRPAATGSGESSRSARSACGVSVSVSVAALLAAPGPGRPPAPRWTPCSPRGPVDVRRDRAGEHERGRAAHEQVDAGGDGARARGRARRARGRGARPGHARQAGRRRVGHRRRRDRRRVRRCRPRSCRSRAARAPRWPLRPSW